MKWQRCAGITGSIQAGMSGSIRRNTQTGEQSRALPGFYSRPDDHLSSGFLLPFVRYGLRAVEYRLGFTREAAGKFSPRTH
jgi:hypothetical protein